MNYFVDDNEGKFSVLYKCDGDLNEKNFNTEEERGKFISDMKHSCKNFEVIDVCDGVCECNECCDKNDMTFERKDDKIIVSVVKEKGLGTTEEELGPEDRKFGNDLFNKIYKDTRFLPAEVDGKFCKECGKVEIAITYDNLSSDEYEKLADYLMKSGYKSVDKPVDESYNDYVSIEDFNNPVEYGSRPYHYCISETGDKFKVFIFDDDDQRVWIPAKFGNDDGICDSKEGCEKLAKQVIDNDIKGLENYERIEYGDPERFDESKKKPFSNFSNLIEFGFVKIGDKIKIAIKLAFGIGEVESSEVGKFFGSISKESEALNKEIASISGKDANSCYDFCNFDYDNCYHAVIWSYDYDEEFVEMLKKNGIEENNDAMFFDIANH